MKIFGIKLDNIKYSDFFNKITKLKKQIIVFTPNPEILLKSLNNKEFKNILKKADFLVPDGIGLYLGAQVLEEKNIFTRIIKLVYFLFNILFRKKYLFKKYGDKICGSDLTFDLLKFAEKNSIKITIIDPYFPLDKSKCKSQETFKSDLKNKFKNLKFNYYIYKKDDKQKIIKKIGESKSKILFSTLGMKKQEKSIIEIMEKCKNIKLGLGVGSSFDYVIGFQKRAPEIFRKTGFEWFYRIFTSPQKKKTLIRIYNAIFVFSFNTIFYRK